MNILSGFGKSGIYLNINQFICGYLVLDTYFQSNYGKRDKDAYDILVHLSSIGRLPDGERFKRWATGNMSSEGAWKSNFTPFWEILKDQPTDRQIDRPCNREVSLPMILFITLFGKRHDNFGRTNRHMMMPPKNNLWNLNKIALISYIIKLAVMLAIKCFRDLNRNLQVILPSFRSFLRQFFQSKFKNAQ